jgi:hypothetical protein
MDPFLGDFLGIGLVCVRLVRACYRFNVFVPHLSAVLAGRVDLLCS